MADAWSQGYHEGNSKYADSRACPYEGHDGVHEWLRGFDEGRAEYRRREAENAPLREQGRKAARKFGPGHPCPYSLMGSYAPWMEGYEDELEKLAAKKAKRAGK